MKNSDLKYKIKKNISVFLLFCGAVLSFLSCDDFLDRAPLDQISQVSFWEKASDLNAYIAGKYSSLPGELLSSGVGYYGYDLVSDNMDNASDYSSFMNGENTVVPTEAGSAGWSWSDIRGINVFLDNYDLCKEPFDNWKHYLGEAYLLKALLYHEKVKRFGDVPWYSHVLEMDDEDALLKPRDKRSVVVDSIMMLMDKSIALLNTRSKVGVNRINKESALILKSRIALFEASWAKYHTGTPSASGVNANAYFQKVMDAYNDLKALNGTYSSVMFKGSAGNEYADLFNKSDYSTVKEVTLARNYSKALSLPNNFTYIIIGDQGSAYGGRGYTLDLIKSYLDKDGVSIDITDQTMFPDKGLALLTSLGNRLDPRFRQSVFMPGETVNTVGSTVSNPVRPWDKVLNARGATGFCPRKGYNKTFPLINQTDPLVAGISFRQAEILLNYAEAYVELNGTFPDMSDNLDLLRTRVGLPTLTSKKPTVQSWWPNYGYPVSDALAIVRQERRIELAGEGFRQDDWMRWRAHALFSGKRKKGLRILATEYTKAPLVDANGFVDNHKNKAPMANGYQFRPNQDYLFPIPTGDILLNPNLTQNPGW